MAETTTRTHAGHLVFHKLHLSNNMWGSPDGGTLSEPTLPLDGRVLSAGWVALPCQSRRGHDGVVNSLKVFLHSGEFNYKSSTTKVLAEFLVTAFLMYRPSYLLCLSSVQEVVNKVIICLLSSSIHSRLRPRHVYSARGGQSVPVLEQPSLR
jgi:hypothetical protein